MKALNMFIVELEKPINDTITTSGGVELYIDTRFEMGEFNNRITSGPVSATPAKYKTPVKVGDTLYFHHLVVMQGGQKLTGVEDSYFVKFDPDHAINNQAILLLPVEEEKEEGGAIELISLKESLPVKGRVAFDSKHLKAIDVKKGDIVYFKENRDYRIKIDGKEYYRTRVEDLMYVEEEVHND